MSELAASRKLIEAPSSSVILRAALSAATASSPEPWASATSVGEISGLSPAASPISAKLSMSKLSVTVKSPCGATSSPSWLSFSASVSSCVHGTLSGVTAAGAADPTPPTRVISVVPLNSLTSPATSTDAPIAGHAVFGRAGA